MGASTVKLPPVGGEAGAMGISRGSGWSPSPGRALVRALFGVLVGGIVVTLETLVLLVIPALVALGRLLLARLAGRLPLLLRLVHGVQDAEVMFRMLEDASAVTRSPPLVASRPS